MTLLELGLYFSLLSLISVGGMPSVIPEMHRYVVDVKGWITPEDFIQMFAVIGRTFDWIEIAAWHRRTRSVCGHSFE